MTEIHLVYPHDPARAHMAPWSIGYNLGKHLRKAGYEVYQYDWEDRCIIDPHPGSILLGHPHPNVGHVFRNSLCGPWSWVASIAPWNESDEYWNNQQYVWRRVDHVFYITGRGWRMSPKSPPPGVPVLHAKASSITPMWLKEKTEPTMINNDKRRTAHLPISCLPFY